MDQLVSQIIPTQRIGNDGFNWWVGQIEGTAADEENNKGGYRYKVRIVGDHPADEELVKTSDLPWAQVMMPVNVPFMPGNVGGAHPQLIKGCWVVGFYLDTEKQKPIIMGSIGQTPGSTTISKSERPDKTTPFQTYNNTLTRPVNPPTDGQPAPENPEGGEAAEPNKTTGALDDGTTNGKGEPRVPPVAKKVEGAKDEKWCQTVAEKCDNEDMKSKTTIILGEFLAEVQRNNGNIGTYLVSPVSGTLSSGVGVARKYVNKMMKVVGKFVAKVKGFIIEKLTNAVKDLIKALIYPSDTGNVLTPVTEWFNNLLKDLGCQMADLGDRLAKWLTNVLMSYVNQIYRAAACQVDALVNGILSKINSLMEEILGKVLGPIQDILGAIATPLNILGGAVNFVLKLLGISCSGPNNECAKYKSVCTDGEKKDDKDKGNDKDFLDDLLGSIDNLFPTTGADYTQYVCDEAYTGKPLSVTTVGFVGGIPKVYDSGDTGLGTGANTSEPSTRRKKITYSISDIEVTEGDQAQFVVTRTGYTEIASSVSFKTLKKGTAVADEDYLKTEGILGFAANETEKTIIVDTLYSAERESDEYFFVRLSRNSPVSGSGVQTIFSKNIGRCTIVEQNLREPYDPYSVRPENPGTGIDEIFSGEDQPSDTTESTTPTYSITTDRTSCPEDEFIVYTINTTNVENGTILYYTLSGNGITPDDIIGGTLSGSVIINNNTGRVNIGLAEDGVVEEEEILRFTLNGTGSAVDVLITAADNGGGLDDLSGFDEGVGDTVESVYREFRLPEVDTNKIITDNNGGIIEIPVSNSGDAWEEPPYIFIGGEGIGGTATPLLDQNGFITEIRIKSPGYGYKLNLATNVGVRCIIDTFTVLSPGIGYTEKPDIYIDDKLGVAEAIINDDGFVIGARILNRQLTFDKFPKIDIVGGGGYGARLLPSLACLDTEALITIGATKIGTGRYVDCP